MYNEIWRSPISRNDGFSLVEALVALSILAGVASVALMVVGSNGERGERATARLRATLAAEAILNRVGLDVALKLQDLGGRLADDSAWTLRIFPYVEPGLDGGGQAALLQVEVRVAPKRWPSEAVELKTLRLVGVPL
ncbi:MAG: hypothetical protein DI565_17025 [Ancylobacter novellus]|uniref:General secretion pathway protein GspI n=1 Tax=Ancylobacter novellus TaxID=921 RepID=A0A2W5KA06_ANCNO|nr:MAG: hypothetical protein DI565_17025 [Ancylobacter novellus]